MTTRRAVEGTQPSVDESKGKLGAGLRVGPENAEALRVRLVLFQTLYAQQQQELAAKPRFPIVMTLPDGSTRAGIAFETTPLSIAQQISEGLADQSVIAKVTYKEGHATAGGVVSADADEEEEETCCNGGAETGDASQLWDLTRPLEGDCTLQFLKFDAPEAQHVFWHSSAHILGEALEAEFGAHLTIGPPLERGFYYDSYMGKELCVSQDLYGNIEGQAERIVKENQAFQRLVLTKAAALEMFKANPFKVALISTKVPDGAMTTCYRCGSLVDLCRGPHIPTTGKVKEFSIEKHSAVYWLGKAENDNLQRVYGVSFPDAKLMKNYKKMVAEAKLRDHRTVGNTMNLFFFESNLSPGSCFWLPDGAKIYNKLTEFIRTEYRHRGFTEVMSPNIYSCDLFKVSGHYQNYKENMYCFDVEGKEWALKPMNCPGHCLMFRHMNPSYRQLPIRMADFGVLHRNEVSGSLTGLIRVRRFQQDDAHIFCRMDQVRDEVLNALNFLFFVYGVFGFTFEMKLSTRPKKALGDVALWHQAEEALAQALDATGRPWTLNPGDGAFYGPKIDIRLQDALQRWHQCGTVQLDFQLPLRFNLQYRTAEETATPAAATAAAPAGAEQQLQAIASPEDKSGKRTDESWETKLKPGHARPVMVHRAILGSIERMTAVLVEHTGGKFPFWLSPRQLLVCPISEKNLDYARYVADVFNTRRL